MKRAFPSGPLAIPPLLGEAPHTGERSPSGAHRSEEQRPSFVWRVPGSKSITNRALLLAGLTEGTTPLSGVLQSDDTRHMRSALSALGIGISELNETTLRIEGGRSRLREPDQELFVGNSGTTVRFLTALATLVPGTVTLVGDEHMAQRPISDLTDGLRQLGVQVDCPTGCPPLTIHGGRLPGGTITMPGNKSSQYFSALLMAAPYAEQPIDLRVQGQLVSRPYVDMTLTMMRDFGVEVKAEETCFRIPTGSGYVAHEYAIEPDASSASYPFATAAAAGLDVTVPHLGEGALQGDYRFVDLLEQAGARVQRSAGETRVIGSGVLRGLDVDMHHISDTVMTLAAIAPLCQGTTLIKNVENIRIKETDRLEATVTELGRLGQKVSSGRDWLQIEPRPLRPCVVHSYSDHRMAMAFAVLGLCAPGVQIENPACVAKTYPDFWNDLGKLYDFLGKVRPF